jgi:hypothetical protein
MEDITSPPTFAFNVVAPFPSLAVANELTHFAFLTTAGKPVVVHFYNSG